MDIQIALRWPGKSSGPDGSIGQSALYHMIDVGAVAEILLSDENCPPEWRDAICLLVALHDVGKIGIPFRSMIETGDRNKQVHGRHWEVSLAYLHHLDTEFECIHGDKECRGNLYAAVAGHHGRPSSKYASDWRRMVKKAGTEAIEDAAHVVRRFKETWPSASLADLEPSRVESLTWWLSGLTTAADWIGSSTEWFAGVEPNAAIPEYLATSRERAARAVRDIGVLPPPVSSKPVLDDSPRPMQDAAADIPLVDGPALYFIEDGTGSGKTEAASILARRMLERGGYRGIYFALPTMATSDAMFERMVPLTTRLYEGRPTLALAHGKARHSELYRELVATDMAASPDEGAVSNEWLADSRRKSLMANVGIGTIDQIMLAALKAKFSTLRQYAIARKVIVIDEIHEMGDPYMEGIIREMLPILRSLGCSVIAMSATITRKMKRGLIEAWGEASDEGADYPSITVAGRTPKAVPALEDKRGPVAIHRLDTENDAVETLVEQARGGATCAWVRNTVNAAIEAARELESCGIEVDLLHSRFVLGHRMKHQERILERYGKARPSRTDRPRVLVATQVVESSLDLDFDVMVSDLAPLPSLVQRMGRMWRHMNITERPASTRPVNNPALHVLSPEPKNDSGPKWASGLIEQVHHIYSPDILWKTAKILFAESAIESAIHAKLLVERVEEVDPPETLSETECARFGKEMAERRVGEMSCVDSREPYHLGTVWMNDVRYSTRLGYAQQALVLVREDGNRLAPLSHDVPHSEVTMPLWRAESLTLPDQIDPSIAKFTERWPEWKRESVKVCPVDAKGTICPGLQYTCEHGLLYGDPA